MIALVHDKLVLAAALLTALASVVWFGLRPFQVRGPTELMAASAIDSPAGTEAVKTQGVANPAKPAERWESPNAQQRGSAWVYEIFTPPEIHYDSEAQQFRVAAPARAGSLLELAPSRETSPAGDSFGIQLIGIARAAFRLQLTGHVGTGASSVGIFQNTVTGETIVGGRGERFDNLDLVVDAFEVRRVELNLPESMTTCQPVATAVVRELRTGATFTLTDRERACSALLLATLAADHGATTIQAGEGDVVSAGMTTFRIGKIRLVPPMVEVTKESAEPTAPEIRTLTLRPVASAEKPSSANSIP